MKPFVTLAFVCLAARLFGQVDTFPPTIHCLNGISVNIMPSAAIDIWATELLGYTFDNQTPQNEIALAICDTCTAYPSGQESIRYYCDDLGTRQVRLWARDLAGNASYCKTYILVQDNNDNCPSTGNGTQAFIEVRASGMEITTYNVCYNYRRPTFFFGCADKDTLVDVTDFELRLHPTEPTYVQPELDIDIHDGVNMLDALKISRHLQGLEILNNPYKLLAADVDQDGKVTWADFKQVRYVAMGLQNSFSSDLTVKFYNVSDTLFPYRDYALAVAGNTSNFIAVKLGDVTGNATFNRAGVEEELIEPNPLLTISPNPFSHASTVQFYLPEAQKVQMIIIDVNGRRILEKNALLNAGDQWLDLNGSDFDAGGWYTVQVMTDFGVLQSKVLYLK